MKTKIIAITITISTALMVPTASAAFIADQQVIGGKIISVPPQIQKAIDRETDSGKAKFLAKLIDLGGGKHGIVVVGSGGWCGAMNCSIWIYQKMNESSYLLLLDTIGMVVRLSTKSTKGYRDLIIEGNRQDGTFIDTYEWNGKQYQYRKR